MWLFGGLSLRNVVCQPNCYWESYFVNDVWYSTDGSVLTQATGSAEWSARNHLASTVFDSKLWLFGGQLESGVNSNEVWSSSNGSTWILVTSKAGWSARRDHFATAYAGKMWVMGGVDDVQWRNDVWSSTDGVTWNSLTRSASWSYASAVYYAPDLNLLYLSDLYFTIWSSSTGSDWSQVATVGWNTSDNLSRNGLMFQDRLWKIGGGSASFTGFTNEVWATSVCSPFNADDTNSALVNSDTCIFRACYGQSINVDLCDCTGNTFIRLHDERGVEVAVNNDKCGFCSSLSYAPLGPGCREYALVQGCHLNTNCSGNTVVTFPLAISETKWLSAAAITRDSFMAVTKYGLNPESKATLFCSLPPLIYALSLSLSLSLSPLSCRPCHRVRAIVISCPKHY
jgi:hypothetical protein